MFFARPMSSFYKTGHPGAADIVLAAAVDYSVAVPPDDNRPGGVRKVTR